VKSANYQYIPALDHLRGFAAILVLFFHGGHFITHEISFGTAYDPSNWFKAANPFSALVIEGHTAVSLFFVLSGFVFTVGAIEKKVSYLGFYGNRILRTYPLFVFFLFLGILVYPENFNFAGLLKSLFFLANSDSAINGGAFTFVFWSIAVEWHFYLLFPALIWLVRTKGWGYLLGLVCCFLVIRLIAYFQNISMREISYWSIIGRIDQFLIGMLAGIYYRAKFKTSKLFDSLAIIGLVIVLSVLYVFNQFGGGGLNNHIWIYWTTIEAAIWAVFILGYLSITRHYPILLNKIFIALGTISYSIYLTHFIVLDFFMQNDLDRIILIESPLGTAVTNILLFILPIVIVSSIFTYYFIEKPFLQMRKDYVRQKIKTG
tara:strand:- start:2145 stop:3269 length:1125 start_codon:yes stop_codon:yes gene_type:complete